MPSRSEPALPPPAIAGSRTIQETAGPAAPWATGRPRWWESRTAAWRSVHFKSSGSANQPEGASPRFFPDEPRASAPRLIRKSDLDDALADALACITGSRSGRSPSTSTVSPLYVIRASPPGLRRVLVSTANTPLGRNRSWAGVWSIFRPINSTSRIRAGRKHGPDPLESGKIFHRVVNGYSWSNRHMVDVEALAAIVVKHFVALGVHLVLQKRPRRQLAIFARFLGQRQNRKQAARAAPSGRSRAGSAYTTLPFREASMAARSVRSSLWAWAAGCR